MRRNSSSWLSALAKLRLQKQSRTQRPRRKRRVLAGYSRLNRMEMLEERLPLTWNVDTVLDNGPVDHRIDMVFLGDGFQSSELTTYANFVDTTIDDVFDLSPFTEYASYFNVHRVDVISTDSGIDQPNSSPPVTKNTALDGAGGISFTSFLTLDQSKAEAAAGDAPDWDVMNVLFNGPGRTNAGLGDGLVRMTVNDIVPTLNILPHEMGHSLGSLADEYFFNDNSTYSGPEPTARNLTKFSTPQQLIDHQAKWYRWLDDPIIDVYEGAQYTEHGIYRPSDVSIMRSTYMNTTFDPVSKEALIIEIYMQEDISTIDDATPAGTYYQDQVFSVTPMQPDSNELDVQWYVDGSPISGATGTTFQPATLSLDPGSEHTIKAVVVDNTDMVRDDEARDLYMTDSREWTYRRSLLVTTEADENGTNPSALSLREALALAANNTTHPGLDQIEFAPGVDEIDLNSALLVDSSVNIVGSPTANVTLDAQDNDRVVLVYGGIDVTIRDLTMTRGYVPSPYNGGAIFTFGNLTLDSVTVSNSEAGNWGGGIYVYPTGSLQLINSTVDGNTGGNGAGVAGHFGDGQRLFVSGSTISNNTSIAGGGVVFYGYSGAPTGAIVNSTLSSNSSYYAGGGVRVSNYGDLNITNSTITENLVTGEQGGGIARVSWTNVTLNNTIVAENTSTSGWGHDLISWNSGAFTSGSSRNLIGDVGNSGLSAPANVVIGGGSDAGLAALGYYGGRNKTHALAANSPAIDKGSDDAAEAADLTVDQRGFVRIFDDSNTTDGPSGTVDIGAFEFAPIVVTTSDDEADTTYLVDDMSLREAIALAAVIPGANIITFDSDLTDETITLTSALGELQLDSNVTIEGLGSAHLTIDANATSSDQRRVISLSPGVTASVSDVTLIGGYTSGNGGIVLNAGNLTLDGVRVAEGHAFFGGGIENTGSLTVRSSVIEDNSGTLGAGIHLAGNATIESSTVRDNQSTGNGGGLYHSSGELRIEGTTFVNNQSASVGGGMYLTLSGTSAGMDMVNSTIADNQGGNYGGGIYAWTNNASKIVRLTNVTVADNKVTATGTGGGLYADGSQPSIKLNNTIVARNKELTGNSVDDVKGAFVSTSSYNLIGATNGSTGLTGNNSLTGTTSSVQYAGLADLGEYGGPTLTYALLDDSPAIDRGSDAVVSGAGLTSDQRGLVRIGDDPDVANGPGGAVDMGAFERASLIVTTLADEIDGDTTADDLSLREALLLAGLIPGSNIITFDTQLADGTITLASALGELELDSDVTITGLGAADLTIDANASSSDQRRVMSVLSGVTATVRNISLMGGYSDAGGIVRNGGDLTLEGVRVAEGNSTFSGGGITNFGNLTVRSSVIDDNASVVGGGIYSGSNVTIESSTIRDNQTTGNGAGFYQYAGELHMESTTITNNQAGTAGGGMYLSLNGTTAGADIVNSTISNNRSNYYGGGIYTWTSHADKVLRLTNVTVAENTLVNSGSGGGLYADGAYPSMKLANTIVALNKENNGSAVDDVAGSFVTTSSYNLIGATNGSTGLTGNNSLTGTTASPQYAGLAVLGNYGGPALTHALLDDSPAIDRGNNALATALGLDFDQRGDGFDRIVDWDENLDPDVDIGAFELALGELYT